MPQTLVPATQTDRYATFYGRRRRLRGAFRFDVRYRARRMREVLADLAVDLDGARVLDVGFGSGAMLAAFPPSCHLTGAEIAASAVDAARTDPRFDPYASARFVAVAEDDPDALPAGPFDVIVSSHVLEHVPNDADALAAIRARLRPGGHLVLFVPLEEADYIPFHLRAYSLQTVQQVVRDAGLVIRHVEGSMAVNGHVWKLLTIPSRRRWPVLRHVADALRLGTLSLLPYRVLRAADAALYRLGVGPRQALVVATRS